MNMSEHQFRTVRGEHNGMAVCSQCDRDASQTRMSYYCVDLIDKRPLRCDDCRK